MQFIIHEIISDYIAKRNTKSDSLTKTNLVISFAGVVIGTVSIIAVAIIIIIMHWRVNRHHCISFINFLEIKLTRKIYKHILSVISI